MEDLTYTAVGHFYPSTRKMIADLMIAPEDYNNRYSFVNQFDISKSVAGGSKINAIFCHITKQVYDNGDILTSYTHNYTLTVKVDELNKFPTSQNSGFDFNIDYSLLLIFHDNTFKIDDVATAYNNLEVLKTMADNSHDDCFTMRIDDLTGTHPITPRKLGVSIIKR